MKGFDRITFEKGKMGGHACIRGLRIPVSLIVNLVANGMSNDEILKEYPALEAADIQEALRYPSWLTSENFFPVSGT